MYILLKKKQALTGFLSNKKIIILKKLRGIHYKPIKKLLRLYLFYRILLNV